MTDIRPHPEAPRLERLVAAQLLTSSEASHCLALLAQTREPLDRVLTEAGLITETDLAGFLAADQGLSLLDPATHLAGDLPEAIGTATNPDFLQDERIWPLAVEGNRLIAGLVDPARTEAVTGLAFATGYDVQPVVMTQTQFDALLGQATGAVEEAASGEPHDLTADSERLRDLASAGPVIRQLDNLISGGKRARASDIHIELQQRDAKIRYRVDGLLRDIETWPLSQALAVISRVKVLADLDITERRRPQDGRFSVPVSGRALDVRVSVVPGQYGESLVLRVLDSDAALQSLEGLGFSNTVEEVARSALEAPHGLILVTGPTGSGKTTTLYAFLRQLATAERKILTIEDPIEYRLPGIAQSQTNPAIGVTFSSALRAFLRHDPDVVMVGEIRDAETARTAVQAAMTGHLVLSTLHTNDARSAIVRLRDMGIEDYLIAATLVASIGQRLVRKVCEACAGTGCETCQSSGLRGRAAIGEAFLVDADIREAIRRADGGGDLDALLGARGFRAMRQDGEDKVRRGVTTEAELMRTLSDGRRETGTAPHGG